MISRIAQVVLFLVALVVVVPPLRHRAAPYTAVALNPLYRASTGDRVERIALYMQRELAATGQMPGPRDLPRVLAKMFPDRPHARVDSWGRDFYFRRTHQGYRIGSMGPDGQRGNNDDVLSKVHGFPQRADHAEDGG